MKLRLDLAHPRPRPSRLGWLLLALGVMAALWAGVRYQGQASRLAAAETALASLAPARPAPARPAPRPAKPGREAPSALTASGQQALQADWERLLIRLETSRPKSIALLALEADAAQGGRLRLEGQARDLDAMLVYLQALEAAGLEQVRLQSHVAEAWEGYESIRFSATAAWGGAPLPAGQAGAALEPSPADGARP
ncbi:MAG: hypothetical protein AB1421_15660 [Pseudomonadota bacterium]